MEVLLFLIIWEVERNVAIDQGVVSVWQWMDGGNKVTRLQFDSGCISRKKIVVGKARPASCVRDGFEVEIDQED